MRQTNDVRVVLKAQDEFTKAVAVGAAASSISGGGGQNYGFITKGGGATLAAFSGAGGSSGTASGDGTNLAYALRLEEERAFQSERLSIIKSANLEERSAIGQSSNELLRKEEDDHKAKLGNTKAMIGTSLSLMKTLARGSIKNNKAMFEADKAFSVGKAIMSAHTGAARALKDYPAPLSYLMAAKSLATGLASARSIASQKMTKSVSSAGGGSIRGGAPAGASRSTVPYLDVKGEVRGTQNLVVNIHNPLSDENWAKVVEDNIIPALESAGERNVLLDVNI